MRTHKLSKHEEKEQNTTSQYPMTEETQLAGIESSTLPDASMYRPIEREISSEEIRLLVNRLSPERTRLRLVSWSLGTFSATVLLSGILMGAIALSPSAFDYQPVKDWMHAVITAEVAIMGAACGYYFGTKDSSDKES